MPTPKPLQNEIQTSKSMPTNVIYADRFTNIGIGSAVTRLTLAVEAGDNNFAPTAQLIMPTPALFEAIQFMAETINNDEIKKNIISTLDLFKEKIMNPKEQPTSNILD
ncbi:hypothetical protein ACLSSQ_10440 [Azospira sp. APE16]|uniref:hypothetical protein n=1 Tax=Azospira sp. APE16 TaxID=3394231 RepID=UPI003A4DB793